MDAEPRSRRRSSRQSRALGGWLLVTALLVAVAAPWEASAGEADGPSTSTLAEGAELYAASCAACHGARGEGVAGPDDDVTAGPPVANLDVALVDAVLRTGRMPIVDREAGVGSPERFDDDEREATIAWMRDRLDLEGEIPEVGDGDVADGHLLYTQNCASCHGSGGAGGVSGDGTIVRGLRHTDPVATVAAIRTGPIGMPTFDEAVLSDEDAADVAAYVEAHLTEPETTVIGLAELGRPTVLLLVAGMALLTLGVLALVGAGPRVRHLDDRELSPESSRAPGQTR